MKGALWQVSVAISEEAEEPVIVIFENLFGRPPSIYTDANTRKTTASIFLEKSSQWNSAVKAELLKQLELVRESGTEIGSRKISVKQLPREDWAESWKKHFQPIREPVPIVSAVQIGRASCRERV